MCVCVHVAPVGQVLTSLLLNPHRYGMQVMEKVLKMAEGIDIGEMRTYELVPSRNLKRCHSPSDSEYILPACALKETPFPVTVWWE